MEYQQNDDGKVDSQQFFTKVVEENLRTTDVISDVKSFKDLMIGPKLCQLLNRHQFFEPTPVQAKAIPLLLLGSDMLVQAKAGTGKTLVFSVLASKILHESEKTRNPLVLILSPTREIAQQTYEVIRMFLPYNFWAGLFVGGMNISSSQQLLKKGCQIAIGTCGRITQLINMKLLNLKKVQLFVMDEADKLMGNDFIDCVNVIFSSMPQSMKQVCVFSATYPQQLEETLQKYMLSPILLRLNVDGEQLIGVKEYSVVCESTTKTDALLFILKRLIFNQCIIFCDTMELGQDVYKFLIENHIDCVSLNGSLPQEHRFQIIKLLKNNLANIVVATDLMARGVDISGVDLVVNFSVSYKAETHLHRVGRAGRYGGKGVAITMLDNTFDVNMLCKVMDTKKLDIRVLDLNSDFPYDLCENVVFHATAMPFKKFKLNKSDTPFTFEVNEKKELHLQLNDVVDDENLLTADSFNGVMYSRQNFYEIYASRTEDEWTKYIFDGKTFLNSCSVNDVYNRLELLNLSSTYQLDNQLSKIDTDQQAVRNESLHQTPDGELLTVTDKRDDINSEVSKKLTNPIHKLSLSQKSSTSSVEFTVPLQLTSSQINEVDQIKLDSIDCAENDLLNSFKKFESFLQFRSTYHEMNKDLKDKIIKDPSCICSLPIVESRLSADKFKIRLEYVQNLRNSVLDVL